MTKYIRTWKRNGWKLITGADVKNQKDLKELDVLLKGDVNVTWVSSRFVVVFFTTHKGICGKVLFSQASTTVTMKNYPNTIRTRQEITAPGILFACYHLDRIRQSSNFLIGKIRCIKPCLHLTSAFTFA